ncbi:MAG TPA: ATP-binding protein, partial [Opitutus sp.]|nr:ATP-binding protein [Opitutus sp.]
ADRGTGLGLATVLRLVKRHDGFVTVETAVGAGSCFTCYFPAHHATPAAPNTVGAAADAVA